MGFTEMTQSRRSWLQRRVAIASGACLLAIGSCGGSHPLAARSVPKSIQIGDFPNPSRVFLAENGMPSRLWNPQLQRLKANPRSIYYQATERWFEPPRQLMSWLDVWDVLVGMGVSAGMIGVASILIRNHKLRQEIDRRRQAEAALQFSESRFRAIFDNTFQFIGLLSPDGTVLEANQTALKTAGVPREAVVGRPFWEAPWWQISPQTRTRLQAAIARAAKGEFVRYEVEVWRADKTVIPIDFSLRPLLDEAGQVVLLIPEGRDLSQAKQLEAERECALSCLQESERRYADLVAAVPVGIFRHDKAGKCIYINDRCAQLCGLPLEADATRVPPAGSNNGHQVPVLGEGWQGAIHPDDRPRVLQQWEQSVRQNRPFELEYRYRYEDGTLKWVYTQAIAERDARGQVVGYVGTVTDISDRKNAEAERRQAEQMRQELKLLELVLDNLLAGYWDWDIANHHFYMSPGLKRMFGYEDDELPNSLEAWQDLIVAEDLLKARQCLHRHLHSRGEIPYYNEVRCRHKNGSIVWVICSGQVIAWDESGKALRAIGCHVEISALKEAEAALRDSEARLQLIADSIPGCISYTDTSQRYRFVNRTYETWFGRPQAEIVGRSVEEIIGTQAYRQGQQYLERALAGESVTYEAQFRDRGGQIRYVSAVLVPDFDAWGQVNGYYALMTDISDRKRVELALQKKTEELDRFFSLSLDLLCIADTEGYFVRLNPQWETTLGHALGELEGARFLDFVHPDDLESAAGALAQLQEGHEILNLVNRYRCRDGSYRWLEWHSYPAGNFIYAAARDITDRQRSEAQIRHYAAQLEISNRELEAFAYSVSHDLRSPLRAIDGFSRALLEDYGDKLEPEGRDYFDRIRKNALRMEKLIEDLLGLSRVSRTAICYTKVDLSAIAREQIQQLQAAQPQRQVEFLVVPEAIVDADATLMQVVLANLLENAWKFTSHHPEARIEFGTLSQGEQTIYFVRDDGAGFDMAYAKKLFGVFQRLHSTNEFPGTGIGLATVQRAIHRHGGRVWAEGAIEQGATFYFTLPHTPFKMGV